MNQKANNQNPSVTGDVPSGSTPPEQPAAQTQNPTIMPGAGASVTDDPVQFDSAHIGTHTAKKQDLFAEQNRLAGEKAQRSAKTRKKDFDYCWHNRRRCFGWLDCLACST